MNKFTAIKEIEISYRYGSAKAEREQIKSSADSKNIFKSMVLNNIEYTETFLVLVLNASNDILGIKKISEGGITSTSVDVRILFQTVLKANGVAFIICHNHPSGKLEPSQADKSITCKIRKGAELLDLQLLDHIIITKEDVFSFADNNLI